MLALQMDLNRQIQNKLKSLKPPRDKEALRKWAKSHLNLSAVDTQLHETTLDSFLDGNAGFVYSAYSTNAMLDLVLDNAAVLLSMGMYEQALLNAYAGARRDFRDWPTSVLQMMFDLGERPAMWEAGDEIPSPEPLTVYRGVNGRRGKRRVRGLSWTRSLDVACFFACPEWAFLHGGPPLDPGVYQATVRQSDIYAIVKNRSEEEVIARPRYPRRLSLSSNDLIAGKDRYKQAIQDESQARLLKLKARRQN